jgi:hypothetical protein
MGTNTGLETLTIGANATSSFNNIVLSAGVNAATTFNKPVITNVDVDITNGGVYRRSNNSDNQALIATNIQTPIQDVSLLTVNAPDGLIPGLYAVLTGGSAANPGITSSGTGCLMYWNGTSWSAGGSINNPAVGGEPTFPLGQYGVRALGAPGINLTFCNGTNSVCPANAVNVYIMLLMAGGVGQLAPFI